MLKKLMSIFRGDVEPVQCEYTHGPRSSSKKKTTKKSEKTHGKKKSR